MTADLSTPDSDKFDWCDCIYAIITIYMSNKLCLSERHGSVVHCGMYIAGCTLRDMFIAGLRDVHVGPTHIEILHNQEWTIDLVSEVVLFLIM